MLRLIAVITLFTLMIGAAKADEAPEAVATSPWAAVTIFAVVIGMMAGIIIWRRRR